MTPFAALLSLSGLSQREAATLLDISPSSVDKMARGVRSTPDGAIRDLASLIGQQEAAARQALDHIARLMTGSHPPDRIELGYPADDHEAQGLGLPTVSAWRAMAARVIAGSPVPVDLVPRGSTLSTAVSADLRERHGGLE